MTELVISFTVDGIHFWPNVPEQYSEFGQPHRHLFKIICWYPITVKSTIDRPIELWELRQNTISWVEHYWKSKNGIVNFNDMSCEGISSEIKNHCQFSKVFVGEEDFFGAIIS